jgi:hypothetical protein
LTVLATMFLVACGGSYACQVTFGASACNPGSGSGTGGGTGGGGGGGGSASGAFVYAIDDAGTIDGYTLNSSAGTFGAISGYTAPTAPVNDGGMGMVVANEQYLYAGFGSTDTIYGWTISSSGSLTAISGSPFAASFMSSVGGGFGTSSIISNPTGTLLFFASTFQDEIYVYQVGSDGTLTAATGSPFAAGISPVNLTTDGLGKYLYATEGTSSHIGTDVAAFLIGSGGTLTPITGSPFAFPMWQVVGEPTGNYLIGTTGQSAGINGSDNDFLYLFAIQQSGTTAGAISQVSSPFATTYSPYSIAVQPDSGGNLVYSFGFNDALTAFNPPEGFVIDSTSGTLAEVSGSPFSNAAVGSTGQFDQSGTFLFVWGEEDSSGTFTYPVSALDVATDGALTEPTSPISLANSGFWVATDPN